MRLIVILIALALIRYTPVTRYMYCDHCRQWFNHYLKYLRKAFSQSNLWQGVIGALIVILPVLIGVGIVYYLLAWIFWGFIGFLLSIVILLYCLQPDDLLSKIRELFHQHQEVDADKLEPLVGAPEEEQNIYRKVTRFCFWHFNTDTFAVLFWYAILGPLGAILYRMVVLTNNKALENDSPDAKLARGSHLFQDVLDWIPVRLLGIGYALVGHFVPGFKHWLHHLGQGLEHNREIAESAGLVGIDADENGMNANWGECNEALALTDRTVIVFLVVLALVTLGIVI